MNCPWAQQHDLIFQLSWTVATLAADQGGQECGGDRGSLWEAKTISWDPLLFFPLPLPYLQAHCSPYRLPSFPTLLPLAQHHRAAGLNPIGGVTGDVGSQLLSHCHEQGSSRWHKDGDWPQLHREGKWMELRSGAWAAPDPKGRLAQNTQFFLSSGETFIWWGFSSVYFSLEISPSDSGNEFA